jgi:SAM-dependent methyltransferase
MRGPLLSGALGSALTLKRVCAILREHAPALVLSSLWLADTVSKELPVTALIEADKRRNARRVVKRAGKAGKKLLVAAAGEELPVAAGTAGCIVVENLAEIADDDQAADFLARVARGVRAGGKLVALDATKNAATEARLAGLFLSAALVGIAQERPKEGALLTMGAPAPAAVLAARR